MSDETELNQKLSAEQAKVESSLYAVELPESKVHADSIMYLAGWAAAMARQEKSPLSMSANSKFWPALAMTFAATTAACLVTICIPSGNQRNETVQNLVAKSSRVELAASEDQVPVTGGASRSATLDLATKFPVAREEVANQGSPILKLFGVSTGEWFKSRDARINRYVAEATSTEIATNPHAGVEFDFEPAAPLTPQSVLSFSL